MENSAKTQSYKKFGGTSQKMKKILSTTIMRACGWCHQKRRVWKYCKKLCVRCYQDLRACCPDRATLDYYAEHPEELPEEWQRMKRYAREDSSHPSREWPKELPSILP